MEIYTAIQEIGNLVASEVYKGQNFQSYLKSKFSEKGSISQTEFDLIERLVKLFLQSLTDTEIYDLWKKTESGSESIDFNKFAPEINSTKSELGNELIDLYILDYKLMKIAYPIFQEYPRWLRMIHLTKFFSLSRFKAAVNRKAKATFSFMSNCNHCTKPYFTLFLYHQIFGTHP